MPELINPTFLVFLCLAGITVPGVLVLTVRRRHANPARRREVIPGET